MACTILGECTPFVDVPFFWSQRYAIAIPYVGHLEPWDTFEIEGSCSDPGVTAFLRAVPIRRTGQ